MDNIVRRWSLAQPPESPKSSLSRRTSHDSKIASFSPKHERRTSFKIISHQAIKEFISDVDSLSEKLEKKLILLDYTKSKRNTVMKLLKKNAVKKLRNGISKEIKKKTRNYDIEPQKLPIYTQALKSEPEANKIFSSLKVQKSQSYNVLPLPRKTLDKFSLEDRKSKLKTSLSDPNMRKTESVPLLASIPSFCIDPIIHADLLPPTSRFTLRELNYEKIVNNAQIRHDLLFEPSLEFISNTGGDFGVKKAAKVEEYWQKIEKDLEFLLSKKAKPESEKQLAEAIFNGGYPEYFRIPVMINEIKEILMELLPYTSKLHKELKERFDIEFINQQIEYGVFKMEPLIVYLSDLLKQHCAPIRDDLIDRMVEECQKGNLIETLKICFDVLELMKLDLANDQLRKIKPHVLLHASEFEWNHFKQQIQKGKFSTKMTEEWLLSELTSPSQFEDQSPNVSRSSSGTNINLKLTSSINNSDSEIPIDPILSKFSRSSSFDRLKEIPSTDQQAQNTEKFLKAFLSLIISKPNFKPEKIPETFRLDSSRLSKYHAEWQDMVVVACLLLLYRQQTGPSSSSNILQVKANLWIILNDADTMIENVIAYLLDMSEKAKNVKYSEKDKQMFSAIVEKTIGIDNSLFQLLQNRVGSHLLTYLKSKGIAESSLTRHGLLDLKEEIMSLGEKLSKLCAHNLQVYGSLYNEIFRIQSKKK